MEVSRLHIVINRTHLQSDLDGSGTVRHRVRATERQSTAPSSPISDPFIKLCQSTLISRQILYIVCSVVATITGLTNIKPIRSFAMDKPPKPKKETTKERRIADSKREHETTIRKADGSSFIACTCGNCGGKGRDRSGKVCPFCLGMGFVEQGLLL